MMGHADSKLAKKKKKPAPKTNNTAMAVKETSEPKAIEKEREYTHTILFCGDPRSIAQGNPYFIWTTLDSFVCPSFYDMSLMQFDDMRSI